MTKRQLTDDEKKLCESSIKRIEAEKVYEEYLVEHADLMLSKGLRLNLERQERDFRDKRKIALENVKKADTALAELKDQIENGVEVKEK